MKIKLAICIGSLLPAGAENLVVEMVKHLDLDKYDIHLFVLEKRYHTHLENEVRKINIKVTYLNKKEGFSLKTIITLFKLLYKFNPDAIHGHLGGAVYASLYCLVFRVKMIHTVHTLAEEEFKGLKRKYFKILYKLKKVIPVGVSSNITQSIKEVYNLKFDPLTVSNGVDVGKFNFERKYSDDVTIGHVGRFEEVKNHEVIIEVFRKLNETFPNLSLILVGDGTQREYIEEIISKYKLSKKVSLIGRVSDVSKYLKKIDVFLMPSLYEGLPLSIIEAMASGCVIVASKVGGVSDIVYNNLNGYLIDDPFNIDDFTRKIESLILDKNRRIEISKQNAQDANKFTIGEMVQKYEFLYQTVIK